MSYILDCWNWISADRIVALVATVGLIYTINSFNKQQKLIVFMDYTKRYQEICLNFPENINELEFSFDELDRGTRDKTLRYMRAYFDLCSEEYHLYLQKYIDEKTWIEWESGIKYALSKYSFRSAWLILKLDTIYYSDFATFVSRTIKNT